MPLRHYHLSKKDTEYWGLGPNCEICNEWGQLYGFGRDENDPYSENHAFCKKHYEKYKNIYTKKIRKLKLEKINAKNK